MPFKHTAGSRVISSDIIHDKRVNHLSGFPAITAQFRTILEMDNMGRIAADPELYRAIIFPRNPSISVKKTSEILQDLHDKGLYFLYESNGDMFLQSATFKKRQKMVGNMKRDSSLPAPSPEKFLDWLINIRKDERFINSKAGIEDVNNMLMVRIEHVENKVDTGTHDYEDDYDNEHEVKNPPNPPKGGRRLRYILENRITKEKINVRADNPVDAMNQTPWPMDETLVYQRPK